MEKFTTLSGIVAPMDRPNVDTDAIIPKQFLKSIKRTGFGPNLFDEWRYLDRGEPGMDAASRQPNPDFVLNQPRYAGDCAIWFPRAHCAEFCRYFFQQLLQKRIAPHCAARRNC